MLQVRVHADFCLLKLAMNKAKNFKTIWIKPVTMLCWSFLNQLVGNIRKDLDFVSPYMCCHYHRTWVEQWKYQWKLVKIVGAREQLNYSICSSNLRYFCMLGQLICGYRHLSDQELWLKLEDVMTGFSVGCYQPEFKSEISGSAINPFSLWDPNVMTIKVLEDISYYFQF